MKMRLQRGPVLWVAAIAFCLFALFMDKIALTRRERELQVRLEGIANRIQGMAPADAAHVQSQGDRLLKLFVTNEGLETRLALAWEDSEPRACDSVDAVVAFYRAGIRGEGGLEPGRGIIIVHAADVNPAALVDLAMDLNDRGVRNIGLKAKE